MQEASSSGAKKIAVVAVDIPSGHPVDVRYDPNGSSGPDDPRLNADMLVSLTAPKQFAVGFEGVHYLGGRFVPPCVCFFLRFQRLARVDDRVWN